MIVLAVGALLLFPALLIVACVRDGDRAGRTTQLVTVACGIVASIAWGSAYLAHHGVW